MNKKLLWGMMFVLSLPIAFAQDFTGGLGLLWGFFQNDTVIFTFGFLALFTILYAIFLASARLIKVFQVADNKVSPQGKAFAFGLGLLSTLGLVFANTLFGGTPAQVMTNIFLWAANFGYFILGLVMFMLVYNGLKGEDPSKRWMQGLAAAGLGFIMFAMLTAQPTILAIGWLLAFIAGLFLFFSLFGDENKQQKTLDAAKKEGERITEEEQKKRAAAEEAKRKAEEEAKRKAEEAKRKAEETTPADETTPAADDTPPAEPGPAKAKTATKDNATKKSNKKKEAAEKLVNEVDTELASVIESYNKLLQEADKNKLSMKEGTMGWLSRERRPHLEKLYGLKDTVIQADKKLDEVIKKIGDSIDTDPTSDNKEVLQSQLGAVKTGIAEDEANRKQSVKALRAVIGGLLKSYVKGPFGAGERNKKVSREETFKQQGDDPTMGWTKSPVDIPAVNERVAGLVDSLRKDIQKIRNIMPALKTYKGVA